eukprot:m.151848 g.151848  ORF g.151848 m.151848 type:complete len:143 (+) comp17874_c0_seq21:320-748(+)
MNRVLLCPARSSPLQLLYRNGPTWHQKQNAHLLIGRGDVEKFKKCRFQATVFSIDREEDVHSAVEVVRSQKKVQKASHPAMAAWVFGEDENPVHGFDDCGESGAGQVLICFRVVPLKLELFGQLYDSFRLQCFALVVILRCS